MSPASVIESLKNAVLRAGFQASYQVVKAGDADLYSLFSPSGRGLRLDLRLAESTADVSLEGFGNSMEFDLTQPADMRDLAKLAVGVAAGSILVSYVESRNGPLMVALTFSDGSRLSAATGATQILRTKRKMRPLAW